LHFVAQNYHIRIQYIDTQNVIAAHKCCDYLQIIILSRKKAAFLPLFHAYFLTDRGFNSYIIKIL